MPEITKVLPLDEALAALDTPQAVADRRKRAQAWAEELEGDARGHMFALAGWEELIEIKKPFRYDGFLAHPTAEQQHAAEREAGRIADAVVLRQCMIQLRARDVQAAFNDPDRMEAERVWQAYAKGVQAVAWAQGNKEFQFIDRFRELIAARRDAEGYDDAGAVRSIEHRLERLTGIPYPQLPEAAWDAADVLPASAREEELVRLARKYGSRDSANGKGAAKTRGRRLAPAQALSTR